MSCDDGLGWATPSSEFCSALTEYFLEDCIQMTNFVPPPIDRKKRDKDEEGGDDDVSQGCHAGSCQSRLGAALPSNQ